MATPTYDPIASTTLTSSASSVTFSSIPADYRDLILVCNGLWSATLGADIRMTVNGDATNYYQVYMYGNGSSASSAASGANAYLVPWPTSLGYSSSDALQLTFNIMDYSATDKHTSFLWRGNNASTGTIASAGRWGVTTAVSSITFTLDTGQYGAGATFSLYGVAA